MNLKKEEEYAVKLLAHLQGIFNEESENFIDLNEVAETHTETDLIHAIANIVPAMFYSKLSGDDQDYLGFNHIANRLCFQYGNKSDQVLTK